MTWLEAAAVAATLVNVYLTARNDIRCWPWGAVSVLLYGYVFFAGRLYASAALQVLFYLPMQFYGWRIWLRSGPARNDDLPVRTLRWRSRLAWLALAAPLAWLLGALMARLGGELTYLDALATALSVVAQVLLSHKVIESWIGWLAVDALYVFYLLPSQRLYPTMVLYAILLVLAIQGLLQWRRLLLAQAPAGTAPGAAAEATR